MKYIGIRLALALAGAWTMNIAMQPDAFGYSAKGLELFIGLSGVLLMMAIMIYLVELCIWKECESDKIEVFQGNGE